MYFTASFDTQGVLFITILLAALSHARPLSSPLEPSPTICLDRGPPPCVCSNSRSIRASKPSCGKFGMQFAKPDSSDVDGTLTTISGSNSELVCAQVVVLEFVANEINKTPRICDAFHKDVNTFNSFFQSINGGSNTLLLEPTVNSAVNELFTAGNSLGAGASQKTKNGAISYLNDFLLRGNGFMSIGTASTIETNLGGLVGLGNGFDQGFSSRYKAAVTAALKSAQAIAISEPSVNLTPSKVPGRRTFQPYNGIIKPRNAPLTISVDTGVINSTVNGQPLVYQPSPLGPLPPSDFPIAAGSSTSSITSAHASISSASVRFSGAAAPQTASVHPTSVKSVKGSATRTPVVPAAAKPPAAAP